jgi:hypothetical protein
MADLVSIVAVIASGVLAATGVGSLVLAYRKLKQDEKQHQELVTSLNNVIDSYDKELRSLRQMFENLKNEPGRSSIVDGAKIELEKQKLEEKKRQNEWKKYLDIARGIKWFLEAEEDEE